MATFSDISIVTVLVFLLLIGSTVTVILLMDNAQVGGSSAGESMEHSSDSVKKHSIFYASAPFYIIAHRGAKSDYPENTMPAFKAALRRGANMIELDVRLSADGIPVVIHDKKVNRTTDAKGHVASYSAHQLQQMDAGSWFHRRFANAQIPLLEEVLEWANDKILVNIELKPLKNFEARHGGMEEKVVNLVRKFKMEQQVLISSFNYKSIKHIENMFPDLAISLLYSKRLSGSLLPSELVNRYQVDAFSCARIQLNKRWIQNLQFHNVPFMVYTVNRPRVMRRLIKRGTAGIFTNKPGVLHDVVQKMKVD